MKNRSIIVYAAAGFAIVCFLLASYFLFLRNPQKTGTPPLTAGKQAMVFRDMKYSGEKKGVVDWELQAKIARVFIDRPEIELESIRGQYRPRPETVVNFSGSKGFFNREQEKGTMDAVDIIYVNGYQLKSKSMDFDFGKGFTSTKTPIDMKGPKLTLRGIGLFADTQKETVRIEKDVNGHIETEKGKYRFQSDSFIYLLKDSTYILEGKVVLKGEDLNLLCDRLYVLSKTEEVERIDAFGHVRLISRGIMAESDKAVYNFKEDRVVLTESPRILRDNIEMEGESIVYNLSDEKFSINRPKMRMEKQ